MSKFIFFGLRAFQGIFAIVVLGLSVTLIKGQGIGSYPASFGYAAFVGGITILGAILGGAAAVFDQFQGIMTMAMDGLLILINLAGGIIKNADCQDTTLENRAKLYENPFFNGGCLNAKNARDICWNLGDRIHYLNSRCRESTADCAFMLLIAILLLATVAVTFTKKR
ncbi:hypothetical protein BU24DRAFT_404967 [Aaosphaeria arxii CBS 175.79]|uniref:MARVEL domain-containing protein n=1 Tax=Aaosphaeria arxii CBS 175.79 TaxID=1450172 RepID=A0A6A5YBI0_9PLEO|nr:uncharacterized protein BU24DRAFT_404967 [Aaosphaeria arxii CBS 175.79]KAF2022050.1 hypothetical protein BU24DRAFT_404967 [Aaosphaeria arxii CBS 175.79]